jgi:stage II sporulation protein AA (anti-sigma F factor antagonist)
MPTTQFTYRRSGATSSTTVSVGGELDIATVPALDRQLRAAERAAPVVVLDLHSLELVDSSGAALILSTDRRMRRAGGRLLVGRGSVEVQWLLALMGVDRELEFVDCRSETARRRLT